MIYLEEVLNTIAPAEDVAAIIVEPIQSDAGVIIPPDDFLIMFTKPMSRTRNLLNR